MSRFLDELRAHLRSTPLNTLKEEWAQIQQMGCEGPTVVEYLNLIEATPYNSCAYNLTNKNPEIFGVFYF